MTLIALTLNHGNPVMMADLLISSAESDGVIETPTFVKGTGSILIDPEGRSYKPLTLMQKLYVVNNRLCLALGGRGDQMYTFLRKVKAFYGSDDFDNDDFQRFLATYPNEDKSGLIAIILTSKKIEKEVLFTAYWIGSVKHSNNERYETVWAAGSGVNQFIDFINSNPKFRTDITDADATLVMNQYLMGYWIGNEVASAESLSNNWGAGFEMIVFRNGKFVKLKEYTVVLIAGKIGKNIDFNPAPINTIMFSYQTDVLIIKAFASNIEKVFAVPAIDETRTELELLETDPKHETLLITYLIHNVDNNREYFPTIVFPRSKNELDASPIKIERVRDKLRLHISSELDPFIKSAMEEIMQSE